MSSASTRNTVMVMKFLPVILVLALAITLCLPAVSAAPVNDTTKTVIVSFQYRNGTVTPAGSRVIYGYPPDNIGNRDMLADLVGRNNAVIGSYGIEDPRVMYMDTGAVLKNEVKFAVILPYAASGDHVDLFDGQTKQKLATADITGAIAKFCDAHRDDPECGGGGPPVLLYGAAILLVLVIIGAAAYLLLTNKKAGGS
jgi:hypothetical protein